MTSYSQGSGFTRFGGRLARQRGEQVIRSQHGHRQASLACGGAHVRGYDHVGHGEQGGVNLGFKLEDVQARAGDPFRLERLDQGSFLYHFSARGIDEESGGFHQGEFGGG